MCDKFRECPTNRDRDRTSTDRSQRGKNTWSDRPSIWYHRALCHEHIYVLVFGYLQVSIDERAYFFSLKDQTYSLWAWMWKRVSTYKNPLYDAAAENRSNQMLVPSVLPQAVRFWRGMYNRFVSSCLLLNSSNARNGILMPLAPCPCGLKLSVPLWLGRLIDTHI